MNINPIYKDFTFTKTNIKIPVLYNNKTIESRYNPERDAEVLSSQLKETTNFVILLGIGSGLLIKKLLEKRPDIFIFAIENTTEDIEFLKNLELINKLNENPQVHFCNISSIINDLQKLYIPAFYGDLQILEQKPWCIENQQYMEIISQAINLALKNISADYSVQCHFGKLWSHNIFSNFKNLNKCKSTQIDNKKIAAIFAAGPSLDININKVLQNRSSYYIISTDTAFSSLIKYEIIPDTVVSIDGQYVSNNHFIHEKKYDFSNTLFLFDLSGNNSAINKLLNENLTVSFFKSGHPLCEYLSLNTNITLPNLYTGSGTVTIAAVDFAINCGFNDIEVFAADFSYSHKPYTKGTYLDKLYNSSSFRFETSEQKYDRLQFRTELYYNENKTQTNEVLDNYKKSFEEYLSQRKTAFIKKDSIYYLSNTSPNSFSFMKTNNLKKIDFSTLYPTDSNINRKINSIFNLTNADISLLPLISWLRNYDNKENSSFLNYLNRAYSIITKYF